jgi:hypothetical protein
MDESVQYFFREMVLDALRRCRRNEEGRDSVERLDRKIAEDDLLALHRVLERGGMSQQDIRQMWSEANFAIDEE